MATHTASVSQASRPELPVRVSWSLAGVSAVWAGVLLVMEWPGRWWLGLAFAAWLGAATWVQTRWPWPGVLLTGVGILALGQLGLPQENAAPLGPLILSLVIVGYLLPPRWSIAAIPVLLGCTAVSAEWSPPSIVFGAVLLAVFWWFGVAIRSRDARRREAQAEAARLAAVDPAEQARRAALAEREGVASAALAVIGESVERMTQTAATAQTSLDPAAIEAIHATGGETVERLRALLVPLRPDPEKAEVDAEAPPEPPTAGSARPPWLQLLLGSWPAALMLLDVLLIPVLLVAVAAPDAAGPPPPPFLLLAVLPILVAVVLRARYPAGALWVATAALAIGVGVGLVDAARDGLWLSIAAAALAWSAGRSGTRRAVVAWVVFTALMVVLIAVWTPDNLPIQIAMTVLPFGAAAAWAGHHAAATAHRHEAATRLAEIDAAERAAISEARLSLARDLHDAASHAVGTMMMQANAARVLRERDPEAAREALATVVATGREAVEELRAVTSVPEGHVTAAPGAGDLEAALAPLVDAARRAGAEVTPTLEVRDAVGPLDLPLLVRIAREGLANAVRHAPGSAVALTVQLADGTAEVSVTNGPGRREEAAPSGTTVGTGLGQRGLRELLDSRGGEMSAGPDGGGYVLRARFPLAVAAVAS